MKDIEIIPAILSRDFSELTDQIALVKGFVKTVQIDVCDGQFTATPSWPYRKRDDSFERIMNEEQGLPGWEDLEFEIDLMANRPEEVVSDWVHAGAARVVIHAEARGNIAEAIALLRERAEIGIAINIDSPLDLIEPYKDDIHFIQCMGIDTIGLQGQDFDAKSIDKVKEIRKRFPKLAVSVDGGVSMDNIQDLIDAGATRLVIGSAIFNAENPIDAVQAFAQLVK